MSVLHVNLNYYATGSATPHVPEICWAASGMVEASDSRQIFEIPDVKRRDGSVVTLRMNMISFLAWFDEFGGSEVCGLHVRGERGLRGDAEGGGEPLLEGTNKYAYDTKIEVTVGDKMQFCTYGEAEKAISDFVRTALPEIEGCLPVDERRDETRTHEGVESGATGKQAGR